MAEPVLRPLTLADKLAWGALRHALWPHEAAAALTAELDGLVPGELWGAGAFDGDRLAGFAEAAERARGDGCDTAPLAWLEGVYVLPPYRRRGLGRRLVGAVEEWAHGRGFAELGSDAELGNMVSRLSHARWGFEETERVVMFRRVLR